MDEQEPVNCPDPPGHQELPELATTFHDSELPGRCAADRPCNDETVASAPEVLACTQIPTPVEDPHLLGEDDAFGDLNVESGPELGTVGRGDASEQYEPLDDQNEERFFQQQDGLGSLVCPAGAVEEGAKAGSYDRAVPENEGSECQQHVLDSASENEHAGTRDGPQNVLSDLDLDAKQKGELAGPESPWNALDIENEEVLQVINGSTSLQGGHVHFKEVVADEDGDTNGSEPVHMEVDFASSQFEPMKEKVVHIDRSDFVQDEGGNSYGPEHVHMEVESLSAQFELMKEKVAHRDGSDFVQHVDTTGNLNEGKEGLGLAISIASVEAEGGKVELSAEASEVCGFVNNLMPVQSRGSVQAGNVNDEVTTASAQAVEDFMAAAGKDLKSETTLQEKGVEPLIAQKGKKSNMDPVLCQHDKDLSNTCGDSLFVEPESQPGSMVLADGGAMEDARRMANDSGSLAGLSACVPDVSTSSGLGLRVEAEKIDEEHMKHTEKEESSGWNNASEEVKPLIADTESSLSLADNQLVTALGDLEEDITEQTFEGEKSAKGPHGEHISTGESVQEHVVEGTCSLDGQSGCALDLTTNSESPVAMEISEEHLESSESKNTHSGSVSTKTVEEDDMLIPEIKCSSSFKDHQAVGAVYHLEQHIAAQTSKGEKATGESDGDLIMEVEQPALDHLEEHIDEQTYQGEKAFQETNGERVSDYEPGEEHLAEQASKVDNEEPGFCVGDLVWAKVKSHPWWPGQVFDAADASAFAKKVQKPGRVLVAFFGDGTFGWLQQSQLVAFQPNFKEKVKQTTMKSFCKAVAEALDELCRRVELGLSCSCHEGVLYSAGTFPDANTGIQKGVRIKVHKDISTSKDNFKSVKTLEYVKGVACSPFGFWSSSLEGSEARGQAYAFRTATFGLGRSDSDDLLKNALKGLRGKPGRFSSTSGQNSKTKRKFSALESDVGVAAEKGKEAKKASLGKDDDMATLVKKPCSDGREQSLQLKTSSNSSNDAKLTEAAVAFEEKGMKKHVVQSHQEGIEDTNLRKGKRASVTNESDGSKKAKRFHSSGLEGKTADSTPRKEVEDDKISDDDAETLFAIAGFHAKLLKKMGKGNLRRGDAKSATGGKAGLNDHVDKKETKEAHEVPTSKSILEVDKATKDSFVGRGQLNSNSSLVDSTSRTNVGTLHSPKASERRTKFRNDLNVSPFKESKTSNDMVSTLVESDKKSPDQDLSLKDKKKVPNGEKSPAPLLDTESLRQETAKGEKQLSSLHLQLGDDVKKPSKTVNLGECIQRIAGELTGTPPITKCLDQTSAKKASSDVGRKSVLKKEKKGSASDPAKLLRHKRLPSIESVDEKVGSSFMPLLQGLLFLARDPLNTESSKKPSGGVTGAFLKFRDMVFQKSAGYGASVLKSGGHVVGKADARPDNNEQLSDPKVAVPKLQSHLQDVAVTSQKHDVQVLAFAARKRKSEVLQEGLAKMSQKSTALPTSAPVWLHASKAGASTGKLAEQSHSGKQVKHYSRRPTSPVSDFKTWAQQSDDRLSSQAPVGLFMKFPQSFALPSEAQLKATFIRFGPLQTTGTRVYRSTGSALVVFKRGCDAEVALKYAKENTIFGQAAVTFKLRYFPHPQKTDTKQNAASFGKENSSLSVDGRTSPSAVEKLEASRGQHPIANSLSLNRLDHGRTGSLEDVPSSHQLQASENPSNGEVALNPNSVIPNSESNVNESSGDIKDQMIKLLRQVSVIVSSSGITTEAT